ncbi:DUF2145 domain-containing protein [Pseudorhodoferax sp.]|uniref:DUF2145 domain-containing protein n=1 Tax=Pseudorhodoferax sp. TaxID=1993553 RepID=UPI002DD64141|nr:DUF2145 domain-containing protein [Pseudorhodoferax sp.]
MARTALLSAAALLAACAHLPPPGDGPARRSGSASSPAGLCDTGQAPSPHQQDQRLQLVARVRTLLAESGSPVALVSRSGTDLSRFGQWYSHAGLALRDNPQGVFAVRQLYYACDQSRPRLFDQGLAGFMLAADAAPVMHVSLLLPPPEAAATLARAALDTPLALGLLAPAYSANAYAFGTAYQNCNQWLAELLAAAWSGAEAGRGRTDAQAWLMRQGYQPHRFAVNPLLALFARAVPLLHQDDHPAAARRAGVFDVSMPVAIEAFVRRLHPGTRRIELCHDGRRLVQRDHGPPLDAACTPSEGDRVQAM